MPPDGGRRPIPGTDPDPDEVEGLARARDDVLGRIAAAGARAGRDPAEVRLVAVTKTVPVKRIRAGVEAGLRELAENRVQEAESKVVEVPGARWHLVGPLQSNKARRAVAVFDVVQSVDSVGLAERLDRLAARRLRVLLQVNVDADPAKAGFTPARLEADLPALLDLPNLAVDGLMTIGRLVDDPELARPTFAALRELSARLRERDGRLGADLSMGMSDDYEVAVEEGATIVRVGRALFGQRPA